MTHSGPWAVSEAMTEKKYLPQSFRLGAVETLEIWTTLLSCALGQMLKVMELEADPMTTGTLSDCSQLEERRLRVRGVQAVVLEDHLDLGAADAARAVDDIQRQLGALLHALAVGRGIAGQVVEQTDLVDVRLGCRLRAPGGSRGRLVGAAAGAGAAGGAVQAASARAAMTASMSRTLYGTCFIFSSSDLA